mgnify:CR=1 FL=1
MSNIFAFSHRTQAEDPGLELYNPFDEFNRFGISESSAPWKLILNTSGQYCETYPDVVVTHSDYNPDRIGALA